MLTADQVLEVKQVNSMRFNPNSHWLQRLHRLSGAQPLDQPSQYRWQRNYIQQSSASEAWDKPLNHRPLGTGTAMSNNGEAWGNLVALQQTRYCLMKAVKCFILRKGLKYFFKIQVYCSFGVAFCLCSGTYTWQSFTTTSIRQATPHLSRNLPLI